MYLGSDKNVTLHSTMDVVPCLDHRWSNCITCTASGFETRQTEIILQRGQSLSFASGGD